MSDSQSFGGDKPLNKEQKVLIDRNDLPLHCPMDEDALWCAHPRVFLGLEDKKGATVRCPYCSTQYIMQ